MEQIMARLDRIETLLLDLDEVTSTREYLNIDEAATFIGVSRQTLDKWRMEASGPAVHRVGRRVLYSISDLREFMGKMRCESLPQRASFSADKGK